MALSLTKIFDSFIKFQNLLTKNAKKISFIVNFFQKSAKFYWIHRIGFVLNPPKKSDSTQLHSIPNAIIESFFLMVLICVTLLSFDTTLYNTLY